MVGSGYRIILLSKCFFFRRHQQFFKVIYWVTASVDYINGLPLEKESNYIFVQTAQCRLISNFLGGPVVLVLSSVKEPWVRSQSLQSSWKLEEALSLHSTNLHRAPGHLCMCQLCSRRWRHRVEQDNASLLLELLNVLTTLRAIKPPKSLKPFK